MNCAPNYIIVDLDRERAGKLGKCLDEKDTDRPQDEFEYRGWRADSLEEALRYPYVGAITLMVAEGALSKSEILRLLKKHNPRTPLESPRVEAIVYNPEVEPTIITKNENEVHYRQATTSPLPIGILRVYEPDVWLNLSTIEGGRQKLPCVVYSGGSANVDEQTKIQTYHAVSLETRILIADVVSQKGPFQHHTTALAQQFSAFYGGDLLMHGKVAEFMEGKLSDKRLAAEVAREGASMGFNRAVIAGHSLDAYPVVDGKQIYFVLRREAHVFYSNDRGKQNANT